MSSKFTKVAAVAASAALVVAGAQSAHAADTDVKGGISFGSLNAGSQAKADVNAPGTGTGNAPKGDTGSLSGVTGSSDNAGTTPAQGGDTGSLKAYGQSPITGSLLKDANATGTGSIDTSGSALGEPTSGSLAGMVENASGSNFSDPATGTGSLDTSKGSLSEPTTGSLAGLTAGLAGSLGTDTGITTVLGSGSTSALVPVIVVGGSIAAGIAAWPLIQNAIHLPPMPGMTPPPAPAPAPPINNGRG